MIQNNELIITNSNKKNELINNKDNNYKIYSENEFFEKMTFSYDYETIFFLMQEYNLKPEIVKIYLENMRYINITENSESKKTNYLKDMYIKLLQNNKISTNKLFNEKIKNNNIIFKNIDNNIILNFIKNKCDNVKIINDEKNNYEHKIYEFKNIEAEVHYVANEISDLIKLGIDISKIYITNLNDEYYKIIQMIFDLYKIPFTKKQKKMLFEIPFINKNIDDLLKDKTNTLISIEKELNTPRDHLIYEKLIDTINLFSFSDNFIETKELFIYVLKNTEIKQNDNINSVHEINLLNDTIKDDEYVFILNFNQNEIPKLKKDEEYFNDAEKSLLNIDTTNIENKYIRENTINKIRNIKNVKISYKLNHGKKEYTISNINEVLKYEVIKNKKNKYIYSDKYNKLKLSSLYDDYYKYGTVVDDLIDLNLTYKNNSNYKKYNNTYKKININDLEKKLDKKINLSYTSVDKFFRCSFAYYLSYILKINVFEETFKQKIGNIFHEVLKEYNTIENFEDNYKQAIKSLNYEFTKKEEFFLKKLKKELENVINTIKKHNSFSMLDEELHEEKFNKEFTANNWKILYTGIIDKIKSKTIDNQKYISIIDYKTGTPHLELENNYYGIGMQLPSYLYLLKNSKEFNDSLIAGFYLQKILNNDISADYKTDYEKEKERALRLIGYSNCDENILNKFDSSYKDSVVIKSMKIKNDGDYNANAKILSSNDFQKLSENVETKINESIIEIINGNFEINPKKIDTSNVSCTMCNFKDICFHTENDTVLLEKKKINDLIGGTDGLD